MTTASPPTGDRSLLERSPAARLPDRALRYGLTTLAALILALILYFFIRLVGESGAAFSRFGVFGFGLTNDWNVSLDHYGALPLVVGTLVTSFLALIIGVPVAVATALYITELCPARIRTPVTILIELLAAVPSVVYGLWGIFFLAPKLFGAEKWVAAKLSFLPYVGGGTVTIPNQFVTGLVLAIMILPIVSAISREVMATVPADQKEAALGLGATRWEMIRLAVLPYCRSGIVGGAMLGLGRAIGETIAVTILIGDSPVLGHNLFGQGYTLAAVVANEFGEASGLHRSALFAAGLVLFVLTLVVNGIARYFVVRAATGDRGGGRRMNSAAPDLLAAFAPSPARRRRDRLARAVVTALTVLALIPLALIVYYLLKKGLGSWSLDFFTTDPTGASFFRNVSIGGIKSAILGTVEIVALASAIAIPIGTGIAIWLVEYGRTSLFATAVRFFVDVLTGVPSIVFGLFIYITLVITDVLNRGLAGYKGALALALLMLPVVIRASEVVLLLVPGSLREAALALGAPRWRVIFRVVVPTALPGMVTGVLLAVARAAGETAPLLFTDGGANRTTANLGTQMNALPLQIYNDIISPTTAVIDRAWGAALALVVMILLLNLIARLISRRSRLA